MSARAATARAPSDDGRTPLDPLLEAVTRSRGETPDAANAWEVCLCALVHALQPRAGAEALLGALPHEGAALDKPAFLNTMAHMGYVCRPVSGSLETIDPRLLPALVAPARGTPFLLLGHGENDVLTFYDPVRRQTTDRPPHRGGNTKVWIFQRYDEHSQPTSRFMRKASGQTWFGALLKRFRMNVMQILLAGLMLNLIALGTPLFIMLVYDRVIAASSPETLPMLAVGAAVTILFEWCLRQVRSSGVAWFAGRLDNVVGNRIFAHLIGLPPELIERASVAAQIARIKTFESVRDFFSGSAFLSLLEAPYVVIALLTVAILAGPLAVVPLVMAGFYIALFLLVRSKVKSQIRLAAKASSARQQFTIEAFDKLPGIRAQGLSRKWSQKFRSLSGREMMAHFRLNFVGMFAETVAHTLTTLAAAATVAFGTVLVWNGSISSGAMVASMLLVWRILSPFYALCTIIPRLEQLRNSIIQVNDLMDIETEAEAARSYARLPQVRGAIAFHNVSVRYNVDADQVFSGLTFSAAPGDLLVITGGNGTGKASVLKLVKSLYRPSSGVVRIDGFDIRQLDGTVLRRQIAYVPRVPQFFHGTVVENLRLSNALSTDEEIARALDLAAATEDVEALPDGLHTIVGSAHAHKLPSSLAVRLGLARAYLHPGAILLIDDLPNDILTGPAGANLKSYLARAKGRRTVILSSYRDDFMRLADTIVVLRGLDTPLVGPRQTVMDALQKEAMAA